MNKFVIMILCLVSVFWIKNAFSSNAFSSSYLQSGLTIEKISLYGHTYERKREIAGVLEASITRGDFAVITLTSEAANPNGCTGTKNGKSAGYYFLIRDTESKLFDSLEKAYRNSESITVGLIGQCVAWGAEMTIPQIYRLDI